MLWVSYGWVGGWVERPYLSSGRNGRVEEDGQVLHVALLAVDL